MKYLQEVHEVRSPNGRLEQDPIHSSILTGLDQVICYLEPFVLFFSWRKIHLNAFLKFRTCSNYLPENYSKLFWKNSSMAGSKTFCFPILSEKHKPILTRLFPWHSDNISMAWAFVDSDSATKLRTEFWKCDFVPWAELRHWPASFFLDIFFSEAKPFLALLQMSPDLTLESQVGSEAFFLVDQTEVHDLKGSSFYPWFLLFLLILDFFKSDFRFDFCDFKLSTSR